MQGQSVPVFDSGTRGRRAGAIAAIVLLHGLLIAAMLYSSHGALRRVVERTPPGRAAALLMIRLVRPAPLAPAQAKASVAPALPARLRPARPPGEMRAGTDAARANNNDGPAPAADFGAAPTLDLGALRALARDNERKRVKSDREKIREGEQVDRTLEAHLGEAARRAVRPDCEKAFAGAQLLAIIPLAASLVTDVGCKWR